MVNTGDESTVLRWATAQAIIAGMRAGCGGDALRTRVRHIVAKEAGGGVRGVYEKALRR